MSWAGKILRVDLTSGTVTGREVHTCLHPLRPSLVRYPE